MAAHQQPPFRCAKNKSTATDSKAAKEIDVWLENPTENDLDRLGELIKPDVFIYFVTIRYKNFDQHVVGKETDHRNNGKLKKASKKVVKVIYIVGNSALTDRDYVTDIGLIKCLSLMYNIPNPYLWIPALDGFEISLQHVWDFYRGGPEKAKSHGTKELKAKACKMLKMEKDLCAHQTFKDSEKQLIAKFKLLKAIEESDSRKNVMTTVESDSGNRAKAMEDSDAKIGLKASKESEPRQKANAAMESDSRKKAKAREKSNCALRQELKATERESRSRRDEMVYDSEAGKGTYKQEEEEASSRPDSKNVRTCMTCGLQEPASKVFKKCMRCKVEGYPDPPYYCGRDCQVLDWTARHRQQHEKNNAGDPATS